MYCRMLPLQHSAILLTFIKLSFVIKIFVLSIFEWPLYTGFTLYENQLRVLIIYLFNLKRKHFDFYMKILSL